MDISSDGGMVEEVNHKITEAKKAWGALKDVWKQVKPIGFEAPRRGA